jgi:hypothetical protein
MIKMGAIHGMRSRLSACAGRSSTTPARRRHLRAVLGSGATLIAAESVGRVCFAVELSPVYVDVAVKALAGVQVPLYRLVGEHST